MSRGIGARFMALGGGEAAARLLSFAGTVYMARTLSPSLYGIIGVAMGIMLYLVQLADAGIELVGVPAIARAQNAEAAASIAAPVLAVRFLIALALTLVVIALGLTLIPQPDGAVIATSALALLAAGLSTRWIHIGLERAGSVAVARTIGEVIALGLIVVLVHNAGDVGQVPLAQFVGAAATSLVMLVALARGGVNLPWVWAPTAAAPIFARARHLVGFTLLGLLLFNFDLIFLRIRTGAEAAGYYAAAYTLISFAANLIVAFAHTVLPTLSRLHNDRGARNSLFQTATAHAFALALPVGVGAWYVSRQIIEQIFGPAYTPGVLALQWLSWTIPLAALRELPVVALIASGEEKSLLRVNAITAICNVSLVLAAVPRFGLVGAAGATVATEFIRLALAVHAGRRAGYPLPRLSRLIKPTVATAAMAAILIVAAPTALWISIPMGGVAYAVALLAMRGVQWRGRIPSLSV
ncbi:MAG: oligosaccharide flippase family protein [Gemmatimonadaceae bacterium]